MMLLNMTTNMMLCVKSLATKSTVKWSLTGIRVQLVGMLLVHVTPQAGFLVKGLCTVLADKSPYASMQHLMALKISFHSESEGALSTFEWLLACM